MVELREGGSGLWEEVGLREKPGDKPGGKPGVANRMTKQQKGGGGYAYLLVTHM